MSSNNHIFLITLATLMSSTPLIEEREEDYASTAISPTMNIALYQCDFSSQSISEQFIPQTNYKERYNKIKKSQHFISAYVNKSLGENILIED